MGPAWIVASLRAAQAGEHAGAMPGPAGRPARGYILVCASTDPAWTPLFVNAAGLILECGGTWIHWLMWRLDQQFREVRAGTPWVKRRSLTAWPRPAGREGWS
jgi:hypothetical protein